MDIPDFCLPMVPSPALTHASINSISSENALNLDLSLSTALEALIHHLVQPLAARYPHLTILDLREHLIRELTELFEPSWDEQHPQVGSGYRSLICTKDLGLPRVLREVAVNVGVDEEVWRKALSGRKMRGDGVDEVKEEWEVWCDPGTVVWRFDGWEWEDVGFEPVRVLRGESPAFFGELYSLP